MDDLINAKCMRHTPTLHAGVSLEFQNGKKITWVIVVIMKLS